MAKKQKIYKKRRSWRNTILQEKNKAKEEQLRLEAEKEKERLIALQKEEEKKRIEEQEKKALEMERLRIEQVRSLFFVNCIKFTFIYQRKMIYYREEIIY